MALRGIELGKNRERATSEAVQFGHQPFTLCSELVHYSAIAQQAASSMVAGAPQRGM